MWLGGESDKKHSARPPGPNMKNTKNKSSDCPLKTLYRSHFGSRYKLGFCGHASPNIMMRVFDSSEGNPEAQAALITRLGLLALLQRSNGSRGNRTPSSLS